MAQDQEAQAKVRFFTLSALRLFGALLMLAGFAVTAGKWMLLPPDYNRILGVILVLVGAFDFAVAPMLLARSWKSKDAA